MKRVLLLNPPGRRLYVRDYYCSKVSKSNYIYQSVDLLMQSGFLSRDFRVDLLDGMVLGWSAERCLRYVANLQPEGILALSGSVSAREDLEFLERVREVTRARILVSGDLFLENAGLLFDQFSCLDGVLLNFSSEFTSDFFSGHTGPLPGILQRGEVQDAIENSVDGMLTGEWDAPVPRHDLFFGLPYTYPFVRHRHFATVLTDFACPYRCDFCVFAPLAHRARPTDSVSEELRFLKRMGIKELYLSDQTFGPNPDRAHALCEILRSRGPFGWVCFLRADLADPSLLDAMKEAGCHTIMFGVESGSDEILLRHRKGFGKERIREAIARCKERDIDTVATFIVGFPEDDENTIRDTVSFALSLDCTYASFNRFVPRFSTRARRDCLERKLVDGAVLEMDQSGHEGVMGTESLTSEEVDRLRRKAVASFYLRPSFLVGRLFCIRSWWDIRRELGGGVRVLGGLF